MKRVGIGLLILSAIALLALALSAGYCVSPYFGEEGQISEMVSPDNAAGVALFSLLGALVSATGIVLRGSRRVSLLSGAPIFAMLILSIAQLYLVERRSACFSISGFGEGRFVLGIASDENGEAR